MNIRIGMLIVVGALAGSAAQADEHTYAELGVIPMRFSAGGGSLTPDVVVARVGFEVNRNFAVELTAATTARGDSAGGPEFKVDSAFGAYLKGMTEVARGLELFAKVGYIRMQVSASGLGSGGDNSLSYAAGAQYHFNKTLYAQIDYASYFDKDGLTATGPSISVGMRF